MRVVLLALACVLIAAGAVLGQVPVNPTTVQFTASTDHNAVTADGLPAVVRYELQIYLTSSPEVSYRLIDLGKPTPDSNGQIVVVFSVLTDYPLPDGEYGGRVVAWGQIGGNVSPPSNTFKFGTGVPPVGGPPPMKPINVGATIK